MATAKMETAAQRYRKLKAQRAANEQLHDVPCPSGMVFKCRKVSIPFMVTSGILPLSLVAQMQKSQKANPGASEAEVLASLNIEEQIKSVEFAAKVVRYVCVEPRIADVLETENDITPDEMEVDDFTHILNWAMSGGGEEAGRLGNFPKE